MHPALEFTLQRSRFLIFLWNGTQVQDAAINL